MLQIAGFDAADRLVCYFRFQLDLEAECTAPHL